VAVIYNGTNTPIVYVNAVQVAVSLVLSAGTGVLPADGTFYIGSSNIVGLNNYWNGMIDEMSHHNVIFSQANIRRIMIGLHPLI
jgi:hypothetical protein